MAIVYSYFDFILNCFSWFTEKFFFVGLVFLSYTIVFVAIKVVKMVTLRGELYD